MPTKARTHKQLVSNVRSAGRVVVPNDPMMIARLLAFSEFLGAMPDDGHDFSCAGRTFFNGRVNDLMSPVAYADKYGFVTKNKHGAGEAASLSELANGNPLIYDIMFSGNWYTAEKYDTPEAVRERISWVVESAITQKPIKVAGGDSYTQQLEALTSYVPWYAAYSA